MKMFFFNNQYIFRTSTANFTNRKVVVMLWHVGTVRFALIPTNLGECRAAMSR